MLWNRRWRVTATGLLLASALAGQGDRARQIAERAIDDLAVDTLAKDATRRLVNLGGSAVPLLRERLAWPTRRAQAPGAAVRMAHALGRIGQPATAGPVALGERWMVGSADGALVVVNPK